MTGYTSPDNLPFPDDYSQPADSPLVIEDLAQAAQVAISNHTHTEHPRVFVQATQPIGARVGDIWVPV